MAIVARGQVSDRPFARTVYWIAAKRFTGDLIMHQDERDYRLAWQEGWVIGAESPSPADSIGRVALTAGLVSSTQVGEVLRRVSEAQASGEAPDVLALLAEVARLGPEQLVQIRRRALMQRAVRVFALDRAHFSLDDAPSATRQPDLPVLSARWLIHHGLRVHYSEERLTAEMASLAGMRFRVAPSARSQLDDFGFGEVERRWITSAIGRPEGQDLGQIATACPELSRKQILIMVYTLVATDVLEAVPSGAATSSSGPRPAESSGAHDTARPVARPTAPLHTPRGAAGPRTAPLHTPSRPAQGRTTPLPVPPGAAAPSAGARPPAPARDPRQMAEARPTTAPAPAGSPAAARGSRQGAPRTVPLHRVSPEAAGQAAQAPEQGAEEAGARATARPTMPMPSSVASGPARGGGARAVKVGRARRRTTLQAVSGVEVRRLITAKVRDLEDGVDHFQLLGLDREAPVDAIRKAYFDLAAKLHPDRLRAVGITDLTEDSQRVCAAINIAFSVLGNEKKKAEYLQRLSAGGGDRTLETKAVQALSAEEHFRRGEWALRRNHWSEARAQFVQAVELSPDEADHHAYLAWTTWCAAGDKAEARTEVMESLRRALDIMPRNLAALYYRGRIAVMEDRTDTALHYFRQVLAIDRGYQDAALQVRLLEGRRGDTPERGGGGLLGRLKKSRK